MIDYVALYKVKKGIIMNFLTIEEVAEKMKVHPCSVRKAIKDGKIFAIRPSGGKRAPYRIAESELERLHIKSMCEGKK